MAKGAGLKAKLPLSDALADFMGKDKASRGEVVKAVWVHIKKHDLQDPDDLRTIIPDDVLSEIIGSKPISMFKMTAKISEHIG